MTMHARILAAIRKIPRGKVSTYGAVARGAGYPGLARQVGGILGRSAGLPWHRVLGAGGEIKVPRDYVMEQHFLLESEGVMFRGRRVDMKQFEFQFPRMKSVLKKSKKAASGA
jgi:methylated-DNA-protein-cysteine methyltransferase-like protein